MNADTPKIKWPTWDGNPSAGHADRLTVRATKIVDKESAELADSPVLTGQLLKCGTGERNRYTIRLGLSNPLADLVEGQRLLSQIGSRQ